MKAILSPYIDDGFNVYLLRIVKDRLSRRSLFFIENDNNYTFEGKEYTISDIIKSVKLHGQRIYYSNNRLMNYIVYDLSQRFWLMEFNIINNMIGHYYLRYRGEMSNGEFTTKRKRK